ncbi:tyrosine-protein kinase domain-containing protein [Mariniluteicoccus flavus]
MQLSDHLGLARRRWLSIAACAMAGLALAALLSLVTKPQYTSKTSVLFAVQSASSAGDLAQGSTYAEKQVQSFAEVATSPLVLQPVVDKLKLAEPTRDLARRITATVPQKTVIIEISVLDKDAGKAAEIANAVGEQLSQVAGQLTPRTPQGQEAVKATVIAPALAATSPTSPKVAQNLALGLLLGLGIGYALALLRDQLDTRVRDEADVSRVTDTSIIGLIPIEGSAGGSPLPMETDPLGMRAESYRRLRTNLQFLHVDDGPRAVVVTSSLPGEGKTTTSTNLAMALAEAGERVLLIDGDLRRPRLGKRLGLESAVGLTTVLIGQAGLTDVVQPYGTADLHILPSGPIPPNPSELLGSHRMQSLLDEAACHYDTVLIDSPPLLPVTDAAVLAKLVGGALVVVSVGVVHRQQLGEALDALETAGARVDGLVLNRVRRSSGDRYAYRYEYRSEQKDAFATAEDAHAMTSVPSEPAHVPARAEKLS